MNRYIICVEGNRILCGSFDNGMPITEDRFKLIESDLSLDEILNNHYYDNGLVSLPTKPHNYCSFNYTTKQYVDYDLDNCKSEYKLMINALTNNVIIDKYPMYRQNNILASGNQTLIDECWDFINSKIVISNNTNDNIMNSTTVEEIDNHYKYFQTVI
jgi:hypothetical protein